jgi:hypothetical protein
MSTEAGDPVPPDVRRFIVGYIDSVPALEALLLMRKEPLRRWTAAMLAAELYMKPQDVKPMLVDLAARGLCAADEGADPGYVWRPATPELEGLIERLADVYARYLVPVTNLIHGKPRQGVRSFSDAFKLRGQE